MTDDLRPTGATGSDWQRFPSDLLSGGHHVTVLRYLRAGSFRSSGIAIIQHVADVPSQGARCPANEEPLTTENLGDPCPASGGPSAISGHCWRARTRFEPALGLDRLQGRDASHRTRNLDTHLTHMCMQLFRHFSRVHSELTAFANRRKHAYAPDGESTLCTLEKAAR